MSKNPYYEGAYPLIPKWQQEEMKRLGCEEEGGVTQVSLRNIEKFVKAHGEVRAIEHNAYGEEHTKVYFAGGPVYVATGFSCGYAGEGPRGLHEIIKKYLRRSDVTRDLISGMFNERVVHLFLAGEGEGHHGPVRTFKGCCDSEFDVVVW